MGDEVDSTCSHHTGEGGTAVSHTGLLKTSAALRLGEAPPTWVITDDSSGRRKTVAMVTVKHELVRVLVPLVLMDEVAYAKVLHYKLWSFI